uniref:Oxysterol-binding protein n=1 Tax=Sinocyclocheilus grahami TaxID=75366 RepID=A0A672KF94_SINGR
VSFICLGNVFHCPCWNRSALPAAMFSRSNVSMWSVLKKCIGMELSKITMPVIFNEPLSFLQRLTEYMEHTYLIHKAMIVGGIPLLGFRWVSEQVSHHPPVSAFHAEGIKSDFRFHGSIYPKLKFWGKSVEAEPRGIITLELPLHNEAYTWTNPTCCVHNIIMGQLWIEQYGNVEIINHKTGERCCLTFKPCGIFGKELHKVEGYILDKSKRKICALYGKWTECLYAVDPAIFDAHRKSDTKRSEKDRKGSTQSNNADEMPPPEAETVQVIPGSELIWRISPRPDNSGKNLNSKSFSELESVSASDSLRLISSLRALLEGFCIAYGTHIYI